MPTSPRSSCPVVAAVDVVGDRWTLVVLRDLLFGGKRRFSELALPEGIATNILSDRLRRLEAGGLVVRRPDPEDARRRIITPTDRAWDLAPALLELAIFGKDHCGGIAKAGLVEAAREDRAAVIRAARAAWALAEGGSNPGVSR